MSEMSPWLQSVVDRLHKGLGTAEQKRRAAGAAVEIDQAPDCPQKRGLMRSFDAYLDKYGYVQNERADDSDLPETVMQTEGDDDSMERGKTHREWREWRRDKRVARAVQHLNAGWERADVKTFIGSKEELAEAWATFAERPFGLDEQTSEPF